jgi:hypothetical protein
MPKSHRAFLLSVKVSGRGEVPMYLLYRLLTMRILSSEAATNRSWRGFLEGGGPGGLRRRAARI